MCYAAGAGGEDCVQLLADSSEITRLRLENDELRSQLPTKEEMRLVKSQMEDALEMKKSFEVRPCFARCNTMYVYMLLSLHTALWCVWSFVHVIL